MNRIGKLAIIGMILLCSGESKSSPIQKENDWTKEKLKGKVKTMTSTVFSYKMEDGDPVKELYGKTITQFNEQGYIVELLEFNSDGDFSNKITKEYDRNNQLVVNRHYNKQNDTLSHISLQYDDKGKLLEEDVYYNGVLQEKKMIKYDEKGNMTEHNYILMQSDCVLREEFTCENGKIPESKFYSDKEQLRHEKHTYNDTGERMESKSYNTRGEITKRAVLQYNEQNDLTNVIMYSSEGEIINELSGQFEYDEHGNAIKISYSENGKLLTEKYKEFQFY